MKQLKYLPPSSSSRWPATSLASSLSRFVSELQFIDIVPILLPLLSCLLWSTGLQHEDVRHMSDLGMISTFPPQIFIALALLLVGFALALRRPRIWGPLLLLHLFVLIFMLYGIQNIVEEAPRFSVVYRHAGYTEYIMRTGSVDPQLDAYFSWPSFFVLSAFFTQIAGYHDILVYAGWAPVFFNLLYTAPLYLIFSSLTTNKRLLWLALWLFFLTDWIGQDYFSPQGFNFFLYLVVIAIVLKWLRPIKTSRWNYYTLRLCGRHPMTEKLAPWITVPPTFRSSSQPLRNVALVVILLLIFAFIVASHPLTPFFVLTGVTLLALFNRCTPRWLPFVFTAMLGAWIIFMTGTFLSGHSAMVIGGVGQVSGAVTANVTSRVDGNPAHVFITTLRVVMSGLIWFLALVGGIRRLRQGFHDTSCLLLACAPFPLIVAQQYGGEMFLRIYLFSLPFMVFFAAALFFGSVQTSLRHTSFWLTLATIGSTFILFAGFLYTRYGNERMDYVTYREIAGLHYLYQHAQRGSLFLAGWNDTPWVFQDFEKYTTLSMADDLSGAVATHNVNAIVQYIKNQPHSQAYVVLTIAQEAQAESFSGLPIGTIDRLGTALTSSGRFVMIYHNTDIQIYLFVNTVHGRKI